MLALYDLCAVLTPCGPLKMLVGLMQERNEPLPGLLYEANIPAPTDFSQSQPPQRQYQEKVVAPSPMSLGVGIGFGSILMGNSGYTRSDGEETQHTPSGNSDQLSQTSSDAGNDLESSDHGLLRSSTNFSGGISLSEQPIVRRINPGASNEGGGHPNNSSQSNRNQISQRQQEHEIEYEDEKGIIFSCFSFLASLSFFIYYFL